MRIGLGSRPLEKNGRWLRMFDVWTAVLDFDSLNDSFTLTLLSAAILDVWIPEGLISVSWRVKRKNMRFINSDFRVSLFSTPQTVSFWSDHQEPSARVDRLKLKWNEVPIKSDVVDVVVVLISWLTVSCEHSVKRLGIDSLLISFSFYENKKEISVRTMRVCGSHYLRYVTVNKSRIWGIIVWFVRESFHGAASASQRFQ